MTREVLRTALVERALGTWEPDDWPWPPSPIDAAKHPEWAASSRARMGAVIDALGILDAAEALEKAEQLARVASDWHLDEVEIDEQMVGIYDLLEIFHAALRRIRGEQ